MDVAVRRLRRLRMGTEATIDPVVRSELLTIRVLASQMRRDATWLLGAQPHQAPDPDGLEGMTIEELSAALGRAINPPGARRNFTYTSPYSIEKTLRAYFDWLAGPGRSVPIITDRSPRQLARTGS